MQIHLIQYKFLVLIIMNSLILCDCCGYHIILKSNESGVIRSPNYPNNYSNYAHCIWMIEVPNNYVVQLSFSSNISMEPSGCKDFIEIRDGNFTGRHLGYICNSTVGSNLSFVSNYRYMWIRFRSNDRMTNKGFSAVYEAIFTNTSTDFSLSCASHMFQCSNFHCVEWSDICNNVVDCGITNSTDDEGHYWCNKLPITPLMKYGISIGSGLFLMFWICLLSGMHQGKRGCFRIKTKLNVNTLTQVQLMIEEMGRNRTRLSLWQQKSNLSTATKRSDNYLFQPNTITNDDIVPYKPKQTKVTMKKKLQPKKPPKVPIKATIVTKPKIAPVWKESIIKLSRPTKAFEFRSTANDPNNQSTTGNSSHNRPNTSTKTPRDKPIPNNKDKTKTTNKISKKSNQELTRNLKKVLK